jgi:general secretion pathway protein F
VPDFSYRALTQSGEVVSGVISAATTADVASRINYLRLVPISVVEDAAKSSWRRSSFSQRGRAEDVTIFTLDLALLLRAGSRLDAALELLATDVDIGRLRPVVAAIRSAIVSGESFADALSRHPTLFPALYVALVRVGEASGALEHILELLATERARSEAVRRKLADALRYPTFLLFAAVGVLTFFLMFVMPQFDAILRDFNANLDWTIRFFLALSHFLNEHKEMVGLAIVSLLSGGFVLGRQRSVRVALVSTLLRVPVVRSILAYHLTALFCRNLGVLVGAAVPVTNALQILADMISGISDPTGWRRAVDRVRHGGKLSDALADVRILPPMAVRMLRLGEETGQLPILAGRVADFYETKLQRSLDRITGFVGPAAILAISTVVGGLIASIMTSLLSVSQIIG